MTNEITPTPRVFKIGATCITENETTAGLNNEQIREILKRTYPEVAHATIREREQDGVKILDFIPVAGRKG